MFDKMKRIAQPFSAEGGRAAKHAGRMQAASERLEPAIELTDAQLDTVIGGIGMIPPKKPSVTYF